MSQSLHYKRELLLNQMAQITSVRQMKRKWNIPASISFPSLSRPFGCCQSSDWFPQGHNSYPIINHHVQWRSCQARRAAEKSRTRALRFDLLLSSRSSVFPSLLNQYMDWVWAACINFKSLETMTKKATNSMNKAKWRGGGGRKNNSHYLTRSQSTFRKNGWPMMSAKPVWGWQPRRSLGSCGSKGESKWDMVWDDGEEDEKNAKWQERWRVRKQRIRETSEKYLLRMGKVNVKCVLKG